MKSTTKEKDHHRQLLAHCQVRNAAGQISERFVDHSEYSLWRFLLEEKHHLNVLGQQACVWVPEEQHRRNENLFSHTAYRQSVSRVIHQCFDEPNGVTEHRVRYVPTRELDDVAAILEAHFVKQHDYSVLDIEAGAAISTAPAGSWFKERPIAAYCAA